MKILKNNLVLRIFKTIFGITLAISLSACGGGGGSSAPNQDASGIYLNGTGTLDGNGVNDIVAIVVNNRFMAFSETAMVVIDGTVTTVAGNSYTATVKVYKNGVTDGQDIVVSGVVTSGSSMTGTLGGTGLGSGDFSLTFSLDYNNSASISNIVSTFANPWVGPMYSELPNSTGTNTDDFEIAASGSYSMSVSDTGVPSPDGYCLYNGMITIPNSAVNVFVIQQALDVTSTHPDCSTGGDYSGYMSYVNNDLIYMSTNGTNSLFGTLSLAP